MKKIWVVEYELLGKTYRSRVKAETEFEALCKLKDFVANNLKIKSAKVDDPFSDMLKGFEDIFKKRV